MNGNNNNSTSQQQEAAVATAVAAAGIEFESDDDSSDEDEGFSFIPTSRRAAASGGGGGPIDKRDNRNNRNFEDGFYDDDDRKINGNANDEISEEFENILSDDDDDDSDIDEDGNDNTHGVAQKKQNNGHDRIMDKKTNNSSSKKSTNKLELLGQRARERYRIEQQQKKQKEIQVVEYIPPKLQSQKKTKSEVLSKKKPPPPTPRQHRTAAGTESSSTTRTDGKRSYQSHSDYSSNPNSKKRRSSSSPFSLKTTDGDNVICWMPDISRIVQPQKTSTTDEQEQLSPQSQQSQASTWVVVHGLPHDSTPDDVRRFFLGLKPQMICVLLTNNVCMDYLLDASNLQHYHNHERREDQNDHDSSSYASPTQTPTFRQPRQSSLSTSPSFEELNDVPDITTARVIVKFESSGIAGLAKERSGETLSMTRTPTRSNPSSSTTPPSRRYYAIGVTQLDKFAAKNLVRNVAVDVKEIVVSNSPTGDNSDDDDDDSSKTKPKIYTFSDYVDIVVRRLPPFALESLWTCVEQKYINSRLSVRHVKNKSLQRRDQNFIKLDDNIKNANVLMKFEDSCWKSRRNGEDGKVTAVDLTSLVGYQSLARHHNRIADIIEDMEEWMDRQNKSGNKSDCYCTVSLRLTERAITGFLEQQLYRLDELAYQARVARRLDRKS